MTPHRPLTPRQREVATLVGQGMSYRQISDRLQMAPRTVRAHVEAIADLLPADDLIPVRRVRRWVTRSA